MYKPGHVNIDKFDLSVADECADALDLPHPDDSFEGVDAEQLLEHFDHIHCKYLLAELFRVLTPGGELVIETPDLERSLERLREGGARAQRDVVHWIYGLDSPGLRHKTGFTWHILKDLLEETGFEKPRREKERTHIYQPGIRVTCRKPSDAGGFQTRAHFRKHILRKLGDPDSYVLIPLEDTVLDIARMMSTQKVFTEPAADEMLCRAVVTDPRLALAVLETLSETGRTSQPYNSRRRGFVEYLDEQGFRGKIVSLWMKSNKGSTPEETFKDFVAQLERSVTAVLASSRSEPFSDEYVMSLEPMDIGPVELSLLLMEARKYFYIGVKSFDAKEYGSAAENFHTAMSLNPWNPFIHWNIARLAAMDDPKGALTLECYDTATKQLRGTAFETVVVEEARRAGHGKLAASDRFPVARYELISAA